MHAQGKRKMGCQWFYKHFDTSMRVEDKGKQFLPAQLDEKILFKARPEDNATFNLFLSVDCVNRRAITCTQTAPRNMPSSLSIASKGMSTPTSSAVGVLHSALHIVVQVCCTVCVASACYWSAGLLLTACIITPLLDFTWPCCSF